MTIKVNTPVNIAGEVRAVGEHIIDTAKNWWILTLLANKAIEIIEDEAEKIEDEVKSVVKRGRKPNDSK